MNKEQEIEQVETQLFEEKQKFQVTLLLLGLRVKRLQKNEEIKPLTNVELPPVDLIQETKLH